MFKLYSWMMDQVIAYINDRPIKEVLSNFYEDYSIYAYISDYDRNIGVGFELWRGGRKIAGTLPITTTKEVNNACDMLKLAIDEDKYTEYYDHFM